MAVQNNREGADVVVIVFFRIVPRFERRSEVPAVQCRTTDVDVGERIEFARRKLSVQWHVGGRIRPFVKATEDGDHGNASDFRPWWNSAKDGVWIAVLNDTDVVRRRTFVNMAVRESGTAAFFNLNIASVGGDVMQRFIVVKR